MPVNYIAPAFELDGQRCEQHQRRRHNRQQQRTQEVEGALHGGAIKTLVETITEYQPAGVDIVHPDLSEGALEMRADVKHTNATDLAVEQFTQWHAARTALGQRDHDFIHLELAGGVVKRQAGRDQVLRRDHRILFVRTLQIADDLGQRIGFGQGFADQLRGGAGAEYQDARALVRLAVPVRYINPAHDHRRNTQHGRKLQGFAVDRAGRHEAEDEVSQRQRQHQRQRGAGAVFSGAAPLRLLVQARGGIDDEHPRRQRHHLGPSQRHHHADALDLGQHHRHQRQVQQADVKGHAHQSAPMQVVVEYFDHDQGSSADRMNDHRQDARRRFDTSRSSFRAKHEFRQATCTATTPMGRGSRVQCHGEQARDHRTKPATGRHCVT